MPMISAKTLQAKLRETRAELAKVNDALVSLHERYDQLETRAQTLLELWRELEPDNPEVGQQQPSASLTDSVLNFLKAHPGARAGQVVDALASSVPSAAKDPKKNLHQTILNLRNRGRIVKLEDGGLRVPTTNGTAPSP